MKNAAIAITLCTLFLGCTSLPGFAQQPSPSLQQDRIPVQAQQNPDEPPDEDMGYGMGEDRRMGHGGMMGEGSMMGEGRMMHHGGMRHHVGMMNPVLMRMIFALMDTDGDGTVSLQEWQQAHEKIFRAIDVDKDGTITFEEMRNFMLGRARAPTAQPQQ
jgi:hypothetical protein